MPELSQEADATIILTQDAVKNPAQARFAQAVVEKVPDTLLIASRSPYDIRGDPWGSYVLVHVQ